MSLILDLLFPRTCYGCGTSGTYLCPSCQSQLRPNNLNPLLHQSLLDGCLSLFPYTGPLVPLLADLKYQFVSDLAPTISELITSTLQSNFSSLLSYWQQHFFTLIPVPLYPYRQNWRGYNQAEIVAQSLASSLRLPLSVDLLIRSHSTQVQAQIDDPSLRAANLKNAFLCPPPLKSPPNCLLFDDVATTHATLFNAAQALKTAGATSVWALTLCGPSV